MKEKLRWDVYSKFCIQSNTLFFNIADKLKQCELTEREIRICVLVLIGLSYAEIAEVLYRAESGIGKDKYLIAKRLGVSTKDLRSTLWAIACKKGTNKQ
jgi:DNA-binding NarL/FixJ family response regulator